MPLVRPVRRLAPTLVLAIAAATAMLAVLTQWPSGETTTAAELTAATDAVREIPLDSAHLRRPTQATWSADGRTLYIANRDSGSISLLDAEALKPAAEIAVAPRLIDIKTLPSGNLLALVPAPDNWKLLDRRPELRPALLELKPSDSSPWLEVVGRVPLTGLYPASLEIISADEVAITSLWTREVVFLDRAGEGGPWTIAHRVRLPFAPRLQKLVEPGRLVVTDAFAGHVGLVEFATDDGADNGEASDRAQLTEPRVAGIRRLPVHNIQGLSFDGKRLWMGCQELNPFGRTTFDDIHWGILVDNHIRNLPFEELLTSDEKASAERLARERIYRGDRISLGTTGRGAADPAGLYVEPNGWRVVALAGSHEVAVISTQRAVISFLQVGERPIAVIPSPDKQRAFVLNQFSDSVSVVDLKTGGLMGGEISLGPMPRLNALQRGEKLFYDGRVSHDLWMSCHSCHTDGHSNGALVDTLGDDGYGAPKRVLSLLGVRDTDTWAWNGQIKELHEQIAKSVDSSMHGQPLSAAAIQDMQAFMFSLEPPPPLEPAVTDEDRAAVARGRAIFERNQCVNCHVPPLTYTTQGAFDVGMEDRQGNRKFNPPSLRGVSQRYNLFHDNRAASLEEAFRVHGHQLQEPLSEQELADLVRFLRSL